MKPPAIFWKRCFSYVKQGLFASSMAGGVICCAIIFIKIIIWLVAAFQRIYQEFPTWQFPQTDNQSNLICGIESSILAFLLFIIGGWIAWNNRKKWKGVLIVWLFFFFVGGTSIIIYPPKIKIYMGEFGIISVGFHCQVVKLEGDYRRDETFYELNKILDLNIGWPEPTEK